MSNEKRYLIFWILVIVFAVIIFSGWLVTVKYNFAQINLEMETNSQAATEALEEVEEMFEGVGVIIEKNKDKLEELESEKQALEEDAQKSVDLNDPSLIKQLGGPIEDESETIEINKIDNLE